MVSALHSAARGLGSRPGLVNVMRASAKHFYLTVPLSSPPWNINVHWQIVREA